MSNNKKSVALSKSEFVESFMYLNGNPINLDMYRHMRTVFNTQPDRSVVLVMGRQCTKSSTMAEIMVANAILLPKDPTQANPVPGGFTQMFVAPRVDQTKVFSYDRINPLLESPFIKKYFMSTNLVQNVFSKQFSNGAKLHLRYALHDADGLRGFSQDAIYYDECQDLVKDVIPVANQGMSRSMYKWNYFAGTPKLTVGTLQEHWDMSTKNEFMPKCGACGKYNYLDEKNVGAKGLICRYCGHILDPRNGTWVRMSKSDPKNHHEGFRISQLHFYGAPWVDWERDILSVYENQSRSIFYNEVLALPYDQGSVPVTPQEVQACCTGKCLSEYPNDEDKSYVNYAGLDYGPENSANSFTLLTIIQPMPDGRKRLIYAKRYVGDEARRVFIHEDVPKQLRKWGAIMIGSDYGLGEGSNGEIRARIGGDKLVPYFHSQSQKARKSWNNKVGVFVLSRNTVMTEFFQEIKKGKWIFPEWDSFKHIGQDLLNVQLQIDEKKQTYLYTNTKPDDTIHSLIFAGETAELGKGIF